MADMGFIPYQVTGQRQTENLGADGRFTTVWVVTFQAPSGVSGNVTIPEQFYTEAYVDAAIQEQLHNIEGIHRLGGSPVSEQ